MASRVNHMQYQSLEVPTLGRWVRRDSRKGFVPSFKYPVIRETLGDEYPERMLALEGNFVACRSIANLASGSTHLTLY